MTLSPGFVYQYKSATMSEKNITAINSQIIRNESVNCPVCWISSETYRNASHMSTAAVVGRAFERACLSVCLFICLYVRALKGKRLEQSTPNLVHIYSIAVAQHALTQRSKGQGHTVQKPSRRTVASDYSQYTITLCCVTCGCCWHGSACQYDWLLMFSS